MTVYFIPYIDLVPYFKPAGLLFGKNAVKLQSDNAAAYNLIIKTLIAL